MTDEKYDDVSRPCEYSGVRKMEKMENIFELIKNLPKSGEHTLLTVVKGLNTGAKALLTDGKVIWQRKGTAFFKEHEEEAGRMDQCGLFEIAGQQVFCDCIGGQEHLVICGGGHVSMPVIRIGIMLGWKVTVLEDRPQFADHARSAGATEVVCMPFEEALDHIEGDKDTYFVVLTRGHRYDQQCLEKIIKKEHAYIGMIGSRRRSALVKQSLIDKGCDRMVIGQVKSPIGLNIGAETPEEIGVAIMAEIIETKNQKKRICGYPEDLLEAILSEEVPGQKLLATIISRKGSAPRNTGSKMLILEDGRCVGTIGGGCMEAEVLRKARLMMKEEDAEVRVEYVDMTGDGAEEEGMICGGTIEVLLEPLWD